MTDSEIIQKAMKFAIIGTILFSIPMITNTCNSEPEYELVDTETTRKDTTWIVWDTTHNTINAWGINYITKDSIVYDIQVKDSAETTDLFYTKKDFEYSSKDTNGEFLITGTLWQNELSDVELQYTLYERTEVLESTITHKNTVRERKTMLFAGLHGDNADKFGIGPELMVLTKNQQAISFRYDAVNDFIGVSYLWRLNKKRK